MNISFHGNKLVVEDLSKSIAQSSASRVTRENSAFKTSSKQELSCRVDSVDLNDLARNIVQSLIRCMGVYTTQQHYIHSE